VTHGGLYHVRHAEAANHVPAAISPIAESPERDTSASPEAVHLVADSSSLQQAQTGAEASQQDLTGGLHTVSSSPSGGAHSPQG